MIIPGVSVVCCQKQRSPPAAAAAAAAAAGGNFITLPVVMCRHLCLIQLFVVQAVQKLCS